MPESVPQSQSVRARLNEIIFGYDTRAGRLFDVYLIVQILLSVAAVMLDSVPGVRSRYETPLQVLEWGFTVLFTLEYILRLYSTDSIRRYALSFYGLVDLISILPSYLALIYTGASYLIVIRILRVLRIFRVLKLLQYLGEATILMNALVNSRRKIFVFLFGVLTLNVIYGSLMYLVEGPENGFTSIPASMYWAIVTLTTVGYGDIAPVTALGRFIAGLTMITGYAIIAVPTGIIGSELINEYQARQDAAARSRDTECPNCHRRGHRHDANYCQQCGSKLP
jgi:voltage-gated potassium channel